MNDVIETVRQSLGRVLINGQLLERFYQIFVRSHPSIAPMFANTDMAKQKELLKHGLLQGVLCVGGSPMGKHTLDKLQKSHGAAAMNVPVHLYPYWKRSLLRAVSETDKEFTPEIGKAWAAVAQRIVVHVSGGKAPKT